MTDIKNLSNRTVNGFSFELENSDCNDSYYECRGDVCYDDEHDETPEPALWKAAHKLAESLKEEGFKAIPSHSEKGWVEVQISK